jgi:PAS domain S-box-containing protein
MKKSENTEHKKVEDILRKKRHLNELLLDNLPHLAMITNKDRIVLVANRLAIEAGAKIGGYCWRDFGESLFIPEQDQQYVNDHHKAPPGGTCCHFCLADEALAKEQPRRNRDVRAWGKIWDTYWIPLDKEMFLHYAIDVTEQRQGLAKLEASEKRFKDLVEMTTDWVWEVDRDGVYTYSSPKVRDLLGYEPEEIIGKTPFDLMPHEEAEGIDQFFREKVAKNEPFYRLENTNRHKDGHWVVLETSGILIFDEDGQPKGYRGIDRDITERKQSEERLRKAHDELEQRVRERTADLSETLNALRESEERYRQLVELSPDGIGVISEESIVFINSAGVRLLGGVGPGDFVGKSIMNFVHSDNRRRVQSQLRDLHKKQKALPMTEEQFLRVDGTAIDVNVVVMPISLRDTPAIQIVFRDIADRRQAERRVLNYQKQLQLLAMELTLAEERQRRRIADELHGQVGPLLAASKIKLSSLVKPGSSTDTDNCLEAIHKLLSQAIEYTRTLTFELSPPMLYTLGFEAALEWLAEQAYAQHGIRCSFESDQEPKPMAQEVEILLFQMVRELLNNVGKHAAAHFASITVEKVDNNIRIVVKDDGVGFDPGEVRYDSVSTSGYGLFSIRERLNYVGGHLEICSGRGRGTQVTLEVPLKQ